MAFDEAAILAELSEPMRDELMLTVTGQLISKVGVRANVGVCRKEVSLVVSNVLTLEADAGWSDAHGDGAADQQGGGARVCIYKTIKKEVPLLVCKYNLSGLSKTEVDC